MPPVEELLAKLQAGEVSGEAVIYPPSTDFPRAMIDWHAGHGFVLLCFDSEASRGHFLTRGVVTSWYGRAGPPGAPGRRGSGEMATSNFRRVEPLAESDYHAGAGRRPGEGNP